MTKMSDQMNKFTGREEGGVQGAHPTDGGGPAGWRVCAGAWEPERAQGKTGGVNMARAQA